MEEVAVIVIEQKELISAIDTVWVSICAAIIFLMEGGFALLEAGFVRSKNVFRCNNCFALQFRARYRVIKFVLIQHKGF